MTFPDCPSDSLIPDVVEASFLHMGSLNAGKAALALFLVVASWEGGVVYDSSLGRALQGLLTFRGSGSPLLP